jgi:hypothetical protein
MGTSTTGRTARPGRRRGFRPGALLAAVTVASLLTGGLTSTAAAAPGAPAAGVASSTAAAAKPAATKPAAKKPATKKPAKKPAVPRTLGALSASMDKAVQAKGSVTHTHSTTMNGQVVKTRKGVVTWRKGYASFDVTEDVIGLVLHFISLPGITYLRLENSPFEEEGEEEAPSSWEEHHPGAKDADSRLIDEQLALMRQQMNPGRLYPGRPLAALKLTPGKPATVGGVKCSVYSVKMTAAQKFASQPPSTRPSPADTRGGTVTTTFYVDPAGLPLKVVVVTSLKTLKYTEVSTFTRWGSPVNVTAPQQ